MVASKSEGAAQYVQDVYKSLGDNLINIVELTGERSQADVAKFCDIDGSALSRYITKKCAVPLDVVITICEKYGFSVDDFLYRDLRGKYQGEQATLIDYSQYEGTYLTSFRNASNGKLNFGVLSICREGIHSSRTANKLTEGKFHSSKVRAIAEFSMGYEDAYTHLQRVEAIYKKEKYSFSMIEDTYKDPNKRYYGTVQIEGGIINISLHSDYYHDDVMIKLPDSRQKHEYIGGIGLTISSVRPTSDKSKAMPCAQKIIISKNGLPRDESYIDEQLPIECKSSLKNNVEADWSEFAKKILEMIETVNSNANRSGFSEEDIATIVAGILSNAYRQYLNTHQLQHVLLSYSDDRKAYDLIKPLKTDKISQ